MNDPEYLNDCVVKLLRQPSTKAVTIEVVFDEGELVPGLYLNRLQIVVAEEGAILGGQLELSKPLSPLSVSPESPEAPSDEDWRG